MYWPVLLCNGRIDPEVLRVSYWRRENARAMLSEEKQKPGGVDSTSTALHLARHFTLYVYIYITRRTLCITYYYKRGNDALPLTPSLLPRSLILLGSNDFGHFTHYYQGHQTRFQVLAKRLVTIICENKTKYNYLLPIINIFSPLSST